MNIIPNGSRVLVRRSKSEDTTPGGIVIPENAKSQQTQGEVIAVGLGKVLDNGENERVPFAKGDVLLFGKYSGTTLESDKELVMLSFDDVLGTVK